jgi:anti-anti-sigma regulatory factor
MKVDAIVFAISGEMEFEITERLRALLDKEAHSRIVLDLSDVTLVSRNAVEFLARVEAVGVRIVNCPDYVRRWIVAEKSDK